MAYVGAWNVFVTCEMSVMIEDFCNGMHKDIRFYGKLTLLVCLRFVTKVCQMVEDVVPRNGTTSAITDVMGQLLLMKTIGRLETYE
jgi:hypothetical protein